MKQILLSIVMIVLLSCSATAQIAAPSSSKGLSIPAHVINPRVLVSKVPLANLFLDKSKHRLVANVLNPPNSGINYQLLDWVKNGHLKRLMKCQGRMARVLWINFYTERVYWTTIPEFQTWMYLHVTSFHKSKQIHCILDGLLSGLEGCRRLVLLAVGKQNSINYRVYWSGNGHHFAPTACIGTYTENIALNTMNMRFFPKQIFYDKPLNKIFLVFDWRLESLNGRNIPNNDDELAVEQNKLDSLNGKTLPLPNGLKPKSKQDLKLPEHSVSVIDYSSSGRDAYYIDSSTKTVYKISLSDGNIVSEQKLTFIPVCIVVDNQKKLIYLLHKSGKIITSIATF